MQNRSAHSMVPRRAAQVIPPLANVGWRLNQLFQQVLPSSKRAAAEWTTSASVLGPSPVGLSLSLPRKTTSLCPVCSREACQAALDNRADVAQFKEAPGLVEADIIEEAGQVLMRKTCCKHGPFEDVIATDAQFFRRIEKLYPGRDFACSADENIHDHGISKIRYGRGSFLVVDLTNRCNMKCSPCFMDANAVGHVHEIPFDDVKAILRRATSFKPRREVNIFFSGGEPTIYPHLLDALRYARELGFQRIHVATNGLRFAQEPDFALQAKAAGLSSVYLQFDGVSNEKNRHRGISNLFDLKFEALRNIAAAGLSTNLQVTVIGEGNSDQVGPIVKFAIENLDKISSIVFQPIMFAGRDEDVDDDRRYAQRYTLSQLAHDLQAQTEEDWQPLRDWFPMASCQAFSNLVDLLNGRNATMGAVACAHHPDSAVVSPLVVHPLTRRWTPLAKFFDLETFLADIGAICVAGRMAKVTSVQVGISILRNFKPDRAPDGFTVNDLFDIFHQYIARISSSSPLRARVEGRSEWRLLNVSGMWFQDLFNFDFQNVEMSTTPVATQQGEISFCAYNAGGWRQIVEKTYQTASLPVWHKQHGRHPIYANGQLVVLQSAGTQHQDADAAVKPLLSQRERMPV